jgi:hypothetical protein
MIDDHVMVHLKQIICSPALSFSGSKEKALITTPTTTNSSFAASQIFAN